MRIAILVEGETERAFLPCLREFLGPRLPGKMPKLIPSIYDGRIPTQEKLKRRVEALLRGREPDADHVIALTDVYTGSNDFQNAEDAKQKMRRWVGPNDRFHPHVAQQILKLGYSLNRKTAWRLPPALDHSFQPAARNVRSQVVRTGASKPEEMKAHSHDGLAALIRPGLARKLSGKGNSISSSATFVGATIPDLQGARR